MKRAVGVWVVAGLLGLVFASNALADSVGFSVYFAGNGDAYSANFGNVWGGEFKAYGYSTASGTLPTSILAPQSSPVRFGANTFQTICAEYVEEMNLDRKYYATIDDKVIFNGSASPGFAPLYDATAILFAKFWNGTLDGYAGQDYSYTSYSGHLSPREESAKSLERAIWAIQSQDIKFLKMLSASNFSGSVDARAKAWYDAAVAAAGGIDKYGHPGQVRVLNVWESQSSAYTLAGSKQSQLVMVVPLPAAAGMTLAGLGALLAGSIIRRMRNRAE